MTLLAGDKIRRVSVIPGKGSYGGSYTSGAPAEDALGILLLRRKMKNSKWLKKKLTELFAGAIAESIATGDTRDGLAMRENDLAAIEAYRKQLAKVEKLDDEKLETVTQELIEKTRVKLDSNWETVVAVAEGLSQEGSLKGKQIQEIVKGV